jgi:uncharacterized protein with predicted RNA binding PUA domain
MPPVSREPSIAELRRLSIVVNYLFGRGVSGALPDEGLRFAYSRQSGRLRFVYHMDRLFATVKPSGAMALSLYGAGILMKRKAFRQNCVQVVDETAPFVSGGRSVFCKFVTWAGKNIHPKSEVVVVDSRWKVLGVGTAVLAGEHMALFKSGAAVKVRAGLKP